MTMEGRELRMPEGPSQRLSAVLSRLRRLRGRRPSRRAAALALAGVLLLCSNLLVGTWFKNWRADLTEDRLYSISGSTRKVLAGRPFTFAVSPWPSALLATPGERMLNR